MADVAELDRLVRGNIQEILRLRDEGGQDAGDKVYELQTATETILKADNAATKIQSV